MMTLSMVTLWLGMVQEMVYAASTSAAEMIVKWGHHPPATFTFCPLPHWCHIVSTVGLCFPDSSSGYLSSEFHSSHHVGPDC